ncbi:MAG: hypothetical protein M0R50_08385 [Candidatus Cloacimonetes bacterium]|jgi:hypothetical protein|nr:hypothetical protein [Candidatus Cloacimonadota bacterium]
MAKLHQIIALAKGKKARAISGLTELHKLHQKTALLDGIARTYRPIKDDDAEKLPSESKKVQLRVSESIEKAKVILTDVIDIVATQDVANTEAFADVVVDGNIVIEHVPATHLLFLEKQLVDLHTFVSKLPTLDPSESWHHDDATDCYANESAETIRTKKIPRNNVKYDATDKHPAQVETWMEDVAVGYWSTTKFSGGILDSDRRAILARIIKLQEAVQTARGEANSIDVKNISIAKKFLSYVFDN